ncbi:hypothetical protein BU26DRAFT_441217 [Trematosphaeria pertusa]|uniref:PD-(D/E)XK nuclease-like domain-containing protein n=1 Tax=Trematosphaeria pertusa TaxID=390896 RepID=A0A6A6HT46_9PLEO|nr:uncharacterized protein BU26DRAFT_441217 [Trematosphaeria pertusa]KAF2241276.1 hypothetical protein BU26DRAFT_441217 [Trematosphaeria pertusa]
MAEESRGRSLRPRDKGNVLVLGQKTPILPSIEAVAADADPVKKKKNKTKKRTKTKTKTKTEASNIHSVDGFDDTQKGKGIQLTSTTQTVAVKFEPGPLSSSYDYRSRSRSRSRSSSPSKRAIKSTADMVHLSPRIEVVARKKAAGYGYTLEDSVARLWDRCKEQPSIDISKMEHVSSRDLPFVERTLDSALSHAADCFDDNVHESQWITKVIAPILLQLEQTAPFNSPSRAPGNDAIRLLDIRDTIISPDDLVPASTKELYKDLDKKIGLALGLCLDYTTKKKVDERYTSINQTEAWTKYAPLFLNIEVKKTNSPVDPVVQLGAWTAAEFLKRAEHGWDMTRPALGLAIEGHAWRLHVVVAKEFDAEDEDGNQVKDFKLACIGPTTLGTTEDEEGLQKLFANLCHIVGWARTEFLQWFEREVVQPLM